MIHASARTGEGVDEWCDWLLELAALTDVYRFVRWCVLVAAGWGIVTTLPSVGRYLKMRSMSDPLHAEADGPSPPRR